MEEMTLQELVATQELLQAAHDYVEVQGFDIGTYGQFGWDGPRCIIGTVRGVAHVRPGPEWNEDDKHDPGFGNGPELRIALDLLDQLAMKDLKEDDVNEMMVAHHGEVLSGRYAEKLGFTLEGVGDEDGATPEWALGLFRAALTEVYKMIEDAS